MKRLNILIACSILAVLVLTLVAAFPARADKPIMIYKHIVEDYTIVLCGIEMPVHEDYNLRTIFWENRWFEVYSQRWVTYTNPDNGITLTVHGSHHDRNYGISDYEYLWDMSGSQYQGTLPGHGVVTGFAGRLIVYVTCHPGSEECDFELLRGAGMVFDDPETVCNYLLYGE